MASLQTGLNNAQTTINNQQTTINNLETFNEGVERLIVDFFYVNSSKLSLGVTSMNLIDDFCVEAGYQVEIMAIVSSISEIQ